MASYSSHSHAGRFGCCSSSPPNPPAPIGNDQQGHRRASLRVPFQRVQVPLQRSRIPLPAALQHCVSTGAATLTKVHHLTHDARTCCAHAAARYLHCALHLAPQRSDNNNCLLLTCTLALSLSCFLAYCFQFCSATRRSFPTLLHSYFLCSIPSLVFAGAHFCQYSLQPGLLFFFCFDLQLSPSLSLQRLHACPLATLSSPRGTPTLITHHPEVIRSWTSQQTHHAHRPPRDGPATSSVRVS